MFDDFIFVASGSPADPIMSFAYIYVYDIHYQFNFLPDGRVTADAWVQESV